MAGDGTQHRRPCCAGTSELGTGRAVQSTQPSARSLVPSSTTFTGLTVVLWRSLTIADASRRILCAMKVTGWESGLEKVAGLVHTLVMHLLKHRCNPHDYQQQVGGW